MNINILPGANSAASALQAEKVRMEVISQNIANAASCKHGGFSTATSTLREASPMVPLRLPQGA